MDLSDAAGHEHEEGEASSGGRGRGMASGGGRGRGRGKASGGRGGGIAFGDGEGGGGEDGSQELSSVASRPRQVGPAPGPGDGVTRASLREVWSAMGKTSVLHFYGHGWSAPYGCFSNFFPSPFVFDVPFEFFAFPSTPEERSVECHVSEKAIMLCKAAAMGDRLSYGAIAASTAHASEIKRMGRQVSGWDDALWARIECSVAYEVVFQKFLKCEGLCDTLLSTEDWLIAESTRNDSNWGTGLERDDADSDFPSRWPGTNMLGWALMQARGTLRRRRHEASTP